jgi:site-specific DNA recombinase
MVSRVKTLKNGKIYHALRCSGRIGGKSCNNETLNVTALKACVKRIFTDIPIDKTSVINAVIKGLSRTDKPDIPALRRKIETLNAKKRRAVDLMLDGLITQQELIEQKSYYDSIIEKLSQEISSDRSVFETDKIRKNAERFLDFTSDPIWLLVIRADYIHDTLTVYLKGIEKGFTTCFTATGRGDSYRVITGNTVRSQGIIPGTMQVQKNYPILK